MWLQIKLRWALFVTYTILQSIMRSEMCSLHLIHPSAYTPGAVGSRHCGARGAVGGSVPCSRVSPQSWTLPARAGIRIHNLGLPPVSSPTLYPLGHDCQMVTVDHENILRNILFYVLHNKVIQMEQRVRRKWQNFIFVWSIPLSHNWFQKSTKNNW